MHIALNKIYQKPKIVIDYWIFWNFKKVDTKMFYSNNLI